MSGPLSGYRILDASTVFLGPYATSLLGDMGADVVRIEAPGGDNMRHVGPARHPGMAAMFLNINRNKRSAVLDLARPEGLAALKRLAETADVLLHNLRPKPAAKLGLTYAAFAAVNPRLVFCNAVGFGRNGPYCDRPAYDDIIQSMSGVASLMARSLQGAPRYVPMAMADKTSGLMALSAILAALIHRDRTGEGQEVELPMFETVASFALMDHMSGTAFEPPLGPTGYGRQLSPYRRPFKTRDGHICVLPYTDKNWRDFFRVAGRPDLAADPRFATLSSRTEHTEELYRLLDEIMTTRGSAEWMQALLGADIPAAPVNSQDDLLDDPHLKQVGFFEIFDHPSEGKLRYARAPMTFSRTPTAIRRGSPRLGEHTEEILAEAGYDRGEIEALLASGAAGLPPGTETP
ncbi:MAG: CoA transferase [Alphaproteobacteria bacterium]